MYNINKKYRVEDLQYAYPFSPNGTYIQTSKILKYTFKHGEEIKIAFQLNDKYNGFSIQISLYTSKYEPILSKTVQLDNYGCVYFELSAEEAQLLQPEIYYCGISYTVNQLGYDCTTILLPLNNCMFCIYE